MTFRLEKIRLLRSKIQQRLSQRSRFFHKPNSCKPFLNGENLQQLQSTEASSDPKDAPKPDMIDEHNERFPIAWRGIFPNVESPMSLERTKSRSLDCNAGNPIVEEGYVSLDQRSSRRNGREYYRCGPGYMLGPDLAHTTHIADCEYIMEMDILFTAWMIERRLLLEDRRRFQIALGTRAVRRPVSGD